MVREKKVRTHIKRSTEEKAVLIIAYFFVTLIALACLLPFMRVLSQAFSSDVNVQSGSITIFPKDFTFKHILYIVNHGQFTDSLLVSVSSTVIYTLLAMTLTVLTAYPLSRKYLGGRRKLTFFVAFTMLFGGGIIPSYLVVKMLGLMDTFWALIIPCSLSAYNMIILITAFRGTPDSFEEAARVDGASHFRILTQIMIPLNKPTMAVIVLFYAVWRWNSWFDALMYTRSPELRTLQLVVKSLLDIGTNAIDQRIIANPSPTTAVQSAAVIFSILPILVLYPFLQKYFVKGVMIGGIKG